MVTEGQYRMAAVATLGYEIIKCKHNPRYFRVVDVKNIDRWPQVKSGLYSKKLDRRAFMHYFESTGRKKAENIGIL